MNSKNPQKKILSFLFLLVISINLNACKKEAHKIDTKKITSTSNIYSEIKVEKVKIKEDSKNILYELKNSDIRSIFLNLDLEKETAILEIDNQKITTDLNFTYDITTKDAIDEIKLLINDKNNLIFLFPVVTEEFLTFQILKYDKLKKTFSDSNFYFETHDDIHKFYVDSKANLSEQNNSYILKIGSYQFKGSFQLKNFATNISNKDIELFIGNYTACIANKREDSIKSETCYEISINSDNISIDANTLMCKGNYKINKIEKNEIIIGNQSDLDCVFKIKRENNNYFINIKNSKDWHSLKKE